jgi:esterase/lipase superfamily enzyme
MRKHSPIIFALFFLLSACSSTHYLVKTPNLYSALTPYPDHMSVQQDQSKQAPSDSEILYITDRAPVTENGIVTGYSKKRSDSMAVGVAHLRFGEDLAWDQLKALSQTHKDRAKVKVEITSFEQKERFPATPLPFIVTPTGPQTVQEEAEKYQNSQHKLEAMVRERLAVADVKDVIIYVHGVSNSFENAVLDLNDVWHFTGRRGVPIAYTWPSTSKNLFGYFADHEASAFTVHHFKETIRILSKMEEVERIHILAHSRGTDTVTSALRELIIEARAGGHDPRETWKVENLIMAAPDLDYGIVKQRLIAEQFGLGFGKITIYMNKDDGALGLSQWLMKGLRFGRLTADKQGMREDEIFKSVKNVSFINVEKVGGLIGHGYFRNHPGVLSDIVQIISTNAKPGSEQRPLTHNKSNFWLLENDYLKSEAP